MKIFPETDEEISKLQRFVPYFLVIATLFLLTAAYIKFFVHQYAEAISPAFLIFMPFALFGLWRVSIKYKKYQ